MQANHLLLSLVLSLTLAACGQDKQAKTTAPVAPVDTNQAASGAMQPSAETVAGMDAHDLYAAKCASCHGATGEGVGGNPKLAGLSGADIGSRLTAYRAGKQMGPKTAVMAAMAKPLTDEQISALARFLGE